MWQIIQKKVIVKASDPCVAQGCEFSRCTRTQSDVNALGQPASDQNCEFDIATG